MYARGIGGGARGDFIFVTIKDSERKIQLMPCPFEHHHVANIEDQILPALGKELDSMASTGIKKTL